MNRIANFNRLVPAKILFVMVVLALLASLGVAQVLAKANTVTSTHQFPLNTYVFVPCANSGAGENVWLSGPLTIVFVTTLDKQGHYETQYELQTKGIVGTGSSTGAAYRASGGTEGTFSGKVGFTRSFESSFLVTGQPPAAPFEFHLDVHATVNSRGGVAATVDNFSVTCKSHGYPSYP